jgi:(1->4)-alpha-D-glucan 1-alpha-D-glucosylmutase
LVDPDNRGLVDFEQRQQLLASLESLVASADAGQPAGLDLERLRDRWTDGRVKLLVTTCGLRFRRAHADFMARASYLPLRVDGPLSEHLVVFARHDATGTLIAVAPRLVSGLMTGGGLDLDLAAWHETHVTIPVALEPAVYRDVITGAQVRVDAGKAPAPQLLRFFPSALLWAPRVAL